MATKHFQRELEKIKKMILSLGALVAEHVRMAGNALFDRDLDLSEKLIKSDYEIDEMEVEIEEECLKVMALHQPVAVDLRFLIAVIKINNDLERIGDEAVNIGRRIRTIAKYDDPGFSFDYRRMAEKAHVMLENSLDALVNLDTDLASKVMFQDDELDEMKTQAYKRVKEEMRQHPDNVTTLINYYLVSRHLERIGDHATNIAEEVIYLIEGEIVRHGKYEQEPSRP